MNTVIANYTYLSVSSHKVLIGTDKNFENGRIADKFFVSVYLAVPHIFLLFTELKQALLQDKEQEVSSAMGNRSIMQIS